MKDNLQALFEAVCDEISFISFLEALSADRADEVRKEQARPSSPYSPGANGWENTTIEDYLASAAAWAIDWKKKHPFPTNPWKCCAQILLAGKSYE